MDLRQQADDARKLANQLFRGECLGFGDVNCLTKEEGRQLSRKEKEGGNTRRPFYDYNPANMCPRCESYFHAERAAQILERSACIAERELALVTTVS